MKKGCLWHSGLIFCEQVSWERMMEFYQLPALLALRGQPPIVFDFNIWTSRDVGWDDFNGHG